MAAETRAALGKADADVRAAAEQLAAAADAEARERARADEAERRAREAEEAAAAASAELRGAREGAGRAVQLKEKTDSEMRHVLRATDSQKEMVRGNMAQLSRIYDEWSSAVG